MSEQPTIEASDLDVYYGTTQILFGVGLSVQKGDTMALLGRNGAGKSTTMKAIMGLAPPRRGSVSMRGRVISGLKPHLIARAGLGFVPEDRQVFPEHTVEDNLLIGRKKGPDGEDEWSLKRIYEVFPLLEPLRYRIAGRLSGGEQQMLAMARTLMATGNLFPRESVLAILDASPGLVVVDEAYYPFADGASFLPEVGRHPNLVLMRTVSKLGLAGLRLGLAVGPGDWMAELEKVRLPYNVNVLTAAAAEFVLGEPGVLEEQTRAIVRDRARLEAGLDAIAGVERFPSAANFVLVRLPGAPRAFEALKSRGIFVKNLHGSHPLLANCLRLTVGTPEENSRLLSALAVGRLNPCAPPKSRETPRKPRSSWP